MAAQRAVYYFRVARIVYAVQARYPDPPGIAQHNPSFSRPNNLTPSSNNDALWNLRCRALAKCVVRPPKTEKVCLDFLRREVPLQRNDNHLRIVQLRWALERPRQFRKLRDGVDVSGGAGLSGRDSQFRFAHTVWVVDVNFAPAEAELFRGLVGDGIESIGRWRGVEEDSVSLAGRRIGKWVGGGNCSHFCGGADKDADGFAGVAFESSFEDFLNLGLGFVD